MDTTLEKSKKGTELHKNIVVSKNKSLHNIYQTEEATYLEISLPGYSKKDIEINFSKDTLRVSNLIGEGPKTTPNAKYFSKGFEKIYFSDTFLIPDDIDIEKISAEMESGVLSITFPLKEEVNINKIIKIK